MRMKIMIIGPKGVGKTTLANYIEGKSVKRGNQDIYYGEYVLDMPSGYLENPNMYDYLIASNQDAAVVLFLIDIRAKDICYPPGFINSFTGHRYIVLTHCDLATPEDMNRAQNVVRLLGDHYPVIHWSAKSQLGSQEIIELRKFCKRLY